MITKRTITNIKQLFPFTDWHWATYLIALCEDESIWKNDSENIGWSLVSIGNYKEEVESEKKQNDLSDNNQ